VLELGIVVVEHSGGIWQACAVLPTTRDVHGKREPLTDLLRGRRKKGSAIMWN
jgi:hypothetical protein